MCSGLHDQAKEQKTISIQFGDLEVTGDLGQGTLAT